MSGLPKGWTVTLLEGVVDILDSQRIPLNSAERRARIAGKAERRGIGHVQRLSLAAKAVKRRDGAKGLFRGTDHVGRGAA